ncbi:MAG TPA: glycosyltransferase [Gemmataceae bacterium]|nr:glycosyltransferase [Gemmataceae bacterium]
MLSFIVPAYNEQILIGGTLSALHAAARALREPYEIIVADDASTDETAAIARAHGAQVVSVNHRHIAATRNAGARQARGEFLFFVDADTLVPAAAVGEAMHAMRRGAVGGGHVFRFDGRLPLWTRILYPLAVPLMRRVKRVGGSSLFCTHESFRAVEGFDETYYAAEELAFIAALKRRGRFVIPKACVTTSGRKLRTVPARKLLAPLLRLAVGGSDWFRRRDGLEVWYGPRKPDPE